MVRERAGAALATLALAGALVLATGGTVALAEGADGLPEQEVAAATVPGKPVPDVALVEAPAGGDLVSALDDAAAAGAAAGDAAAAAGDADKSADAAGAGDVPDADAEPADDLVAAFEGVSEAAADVADAIDGAGAALPADELETDDSRPADEPASGAGLPDGEPEAEAEPPASDADLMAPQHTSGWNQVDGSWYWYEEGATEASTGWVVTDSAPVEGGEAGLQRYWIDPLTGTLAMSQLFCADAATGWWAYATEYGYVVRGTHAVSDGDRTLVYVADNDGRLAAPGWVVSDAYGQGLQRYWIDEQAHAAVVGASSEGGWAHYTTPEGYVLRGGREFEDGRRYADDDGRLAVGGWVVTGDFTGGALQRYWAGDDGTFFSDGLFCAGDGWNAYALEDGTILRGTLSFTGDDGRAYVYLADNDGRLAAPGWVVSDAYGQGLQRYWVDADELAAVVGYFRAEGNVYFGTEAGYVLRGKLSFEDGVQLADNDGKLAENLFEEGWVVTGVFDGGNAQRYYLVSAGGHLYAEVGLFEASINGTQSSFYGVEGEGYVLRNARIKIDGKSYDADNDGVLVVAKVRVYLDAGHGMGSSYVGSWDPGANGCGYDEANLTRELVDMVASIVRDTYGIEVVTNGEIPYRERQAEAEALGCTFFVSIHFNATYGGWGGTASGTESYIHSVHAAPGSDVLQDVMHRHLVSGTGLSDRGQHEEQFAVCGGNVPATLLEVCFIDNSYDMSQYQARKQFVAEQIAAGINEFASMGVV